MKLLTIGQRNNWNSYMQIIRLLSLWYKKFVSTYRHKLQTVLGTREQFEYFDKANALSSLTSRKKSESYIQRPRVKTDWEQVQHRVKSGGVRHDPQRLKGLKRKRLKGLFIVESALSLSS